MDQKDQLIKDLRKELLRFQSTLEEQAEKLDDCKIAFNEILQILSNVVPSAWPVPQQET